MASNKILAIINISLALLAFLLILQLFEIKLPVLGKASYENKAGAECVINWGDEYNSWNDLDGCCLEARKQLDCYKDSILFENKRLEWVCQTGQGRTLKYWLNEKAYNYCTQQVIW